MKQWTIDVERDDNGAFITLPDEVIEETGWKPGDRIQWIDRKDGSFEMKKIDTQFVLVECVQQFRMRYVVEVPIGKYYLNDEVRDKSEWALDTVTMEEAKEFSQKSLGENIVSHRVISHDDLIKLCDEDNDYAQTWPDDKKFEAFVTEWKGNE